MEYFIICSVAFLISGLSLFSGFGLGTVLLPVFAVFFPIYIAVTLTAIVHLSNNIFKFILLGRYADRKAVFQFGIPAVLAAIAGAKVLFWLSELKPLVQYQLSGYIFKITPVKLIVAILMILFAFIEIAPRFEKLSFQKKYLPLGGILSGFFGGLSGHQGALRSAFLMKSGLGKESFIATGVAISCLVDFSRIFIYSGYFPSIIKSNSMVLLMSAILSAFLGAFIGNRLLNKITMRVIRLIVAILLITIAIALGIGII
ncbi:MAG: hypothetical protein COS99_05685 [Candidatus Omnitrophica bacterium CG07_land_8_20_14_0_80_42_15]|uniref:Probable membrane transporter protein n=1 Tax=Candidatus Aquitaenariimonas noxiae TaxID=1974741 RepID=A0A2J0KRZ3_9BACT|nr:MAG: hypothetical protein COS99_05685 [Candidatus Omnitrophica bacterium CG07_land_8_20_14_0_80_42_15]